MRRNLALDEELVGSPDDKSREAGPPATPPSLLERRAMLDSVPELEAPASQPLAAGQPLVTVCGVPLEAGERVVFFAHPRHLRQKLLYVLVGALLSPLVVGIAFIAYGLMYQRYNLRFVAITNHRIILSKGTKSVRWLRLSDVIDVRAKRAASTAQAIGAIGTGASPSARTTDRTLPEHWRGAEGVTIQAKRGALSIDDSVPPERLGPAIANAVWTEHYVERVPTVHHPS
jgi:hypothetical protein